MQRNPALEWRRVDPALLDLTGKSVAVVGGTGGIGRALSRFLASRGAHVWVVGRTFRDAGTRGIDFLEADLSLTKEARRVGRLLPAESLDVVVFTTGIFAAPHREETSEGLERDLAVSFLSRLAIVRELAPQLGTRRIASTKPRVFVMGYPGTGQTGAIDDLNSERSYRMMSAHMTTVAGNEALVLHSARRYPNLSCFGLNPGLIKSNIRGNIFGEGTLRQRALEWVIGLLTPSAEQYAERVTPLLFSPDLEGHSGAMFNSKGDAILPSKGLTEAYVQRFIDASEALFEAY